MFLLLCYSCLLGSNLSQIAQLAELRTVNPLVVGSSPTLGAMTKNPLYANYGKTLIGKKVELILCTDEFTALTPGTKGIINFVDDIGTVFVNWENGSTLGLIPGIDKWKYL